MKHIPDLKVIHVRFIKSSSTPDSRPIANNYESSSSRQQCFSEPVMPPQRNRQDPNKAQRTGSPNAKHVIPKSLSISHMMKLGKLAKPNEWVTRWPLLTGQNITGQSFAFQWGQEMFLASCLEPFREFPLIMLHKLAGPYPRNTLVYFWALPDISELILCTTNSCLSRMLPFSFFFAPPSPVLCLFAFISFLNVPQDFFLQSAMLTCHKVEPARHLGLWQF